MNEDAINAIFNSTNINLATREIERNKKSSEIISKIIYFFNKGREIASTFTALQSTTFLSEPWSNTSKLIIVLCLQIDVRSVDEFNSQNRAFYALHIGLLVEVAFSGKIEAAWEFAKIITIYGEDTKYYVSDKDLSAIKMVALIYAPELIGYAEDIYKQSISNSKIVAEYFITKLQPYLQKRNPNAFFGFAIVLIKCNSIDSDITKAFKLLTIAADLGHVEAERLGRKMAAKYPDLLSVRKNDQLGAAEKNITLPNNSIEIEASAAQKVSLLSNRTNLILKFSNLLQQHSTLVTLNSIQLASLPKKEISLPASNLSNSERICLAMMKNEPYCTIIAVAEKTAAEWLASLPWDCHLLYEGSFQPENNTVDRCLRLMASNGYPAKSGELCSAPASVAMDSLLISTYEFAYEQGRLGV